MSKATLLSSIILTSFLTVTLAFAPYTQHIPFPTTQMDPRNRLPRELYASSSTSSASTTITLQEGLTKTILQPGRGPALKLGDVATVSYNCYLADTKQTFSKSPKQKVIVGGGSMIDGWEQGLRNMAVGEKAILSIAPEYGYGSEGVGTIVPPDSVLEIELEVLDAEEQTQLGSAGVVASVSGMTGSGDWGNLDPMKPRTPQAIDAAYKAKQRQLALEKADEKEGIAGFLDKLTSGRFYFFGLFEGETGQRAPWYLRPSITFPIAFAVVGLGFYATFALGGISERGSQVKDELDDVILSFQVMKTLVDSSTVSLSV
jgi:hypothetical protein